MNKNMKTALIIGGIVIAILVVLPGVFGLIWGGQDYGGWGMVGQGITGGFGWMWLMPIFWILFLGLILWGAVALVRGAGQPRGIDTSSGQPDSALEVLRKRYARGEINKEEYEEKKKDLE